MIANLVAKGVGAATKLCQIRIQVGRQAFILSFLYKFVADRKYQALVFPVITTLQKLSNHLALLIPNTSDVKDKQERELEILQTMVPDRWEELYNNRDSILSLSNPEFCGKVSILSQYEKYANRL